MRTHLSSGRKRPSAIRTYPFIVTIMKPWSLPGSKLVQGTSDGNVPRYVVDGKPREDSFLTVTGYLQHAVSHKGNRLELATRFYRPRKNLTLVIHGDKPPIGD